jgi:hypothetical protein
MAEPTIVHDAYATLSAMITPAIFLTANASMIISTSNRVSRVVDRIRTLNEQADRMDRGVTDEDYLPERIEHILAQLNSQQTRSDRLRFALAALYVAFSAFVGTSLALALHTILSISHLALPTLLAMIGVVCLLFASVNLAREALLALRGNRTEIEFFRKLHQRRAQDRRSSA